jgi:hypothetical protein
LIAGPALSSSRNTVLRRYVHTAVGSAWGFPIRGASGETLVQSTQPRDLAALAFVVGLFAVLLVVSLMVGAPAAR